MSLTTEKTDNKVVLLVEVLSEQKSETAALRSGANSRLFFSSSFSLSATTMQRICSHTEAFAGIKAKRQQVQLQSAAAVTREGRPLS